MEHGGWRRPRWPVRSRRRAPYYRRHRGETTDRGGPHGHPGSNHPPVHGSHGPRRAAGGERASCRQCGRRPRPDDHRHRQRRTRRWDSASGTGADSVATARSEPSTCTLPTPSGGSSGPRESWVCPGPSWPESCPSTVTSSRCSRPCGTRRRGTSAGWTHAPSPPPSGRRDGSAPWASRCPLRPRRADRPDASTRRPATPGPSATTTTWATTSTSWCSVRVGRTRVPGS